jgi:pimeloyl-ACP methyl ester carboxylesterase
MNFARELIVVAVVSALLGCSEEEVKTEASAVTELSIVEMQDTRYTLGDGGISSFYQFDGEIPAGPGTLLRQEPLQAHQSVPGAAENLRLLYTSTDGLDGETPVIVSGALFLPAGTPPEGGWPLLLWSHGTVGIADICAPTWTGYVPFHQEHLKRWVEAGYAIVASDYQGLGTLGTHPYLATRPAAFNNLDVIRAVQAADFPLTDKVVIAGQSQGAGAVIATAGYAPDYAPDIDLRGVVATGVPYFSPEGLVAVREMRPQDVVDPMLGYNFLALTLIQQINPDFNIEDYVSDAALPMAQGVARICNRDMRAKIEEAGLTYNMTFKQSPSEHLIEAFRKMQFPSLTLSVPLFVGSGAIDRDTPLRMQAGFVKRACAAGSIVEAHLYNEHDHLTTLNRSTMDSATFVAAAFAGDEISGNCNSLPYDN